LGIKGKKGWGFPDLLYQGRGGKKRGGKGTFSGGEEKNSQGRRSRTGGGGEREGEKKESTSTWPNPGGKKRARRQNHRNFAILKREEKVLKGRGVGLSRIRRGWNNLKSEALLLPPILKKKKEEGKGSRTGRSKGNFPMAGRKSPLTTSPGKKNENPKEKRTPANTCLLF